MRLLLAMMALPVGLLLAQTAPTGPPPAPHVVQRGSDSAPVSVKLLNTGKSDDDATIDKFLALTVFAVAVLQTVILAVSLAETRKTARTQQRAYVFLDRIICLRPEVRPPEMSLYRVIVRNSGQTPAHDVRIIAVHSFGPVLLSEALRTPKSTALATSDVIPAGAKLVSEIPQFTLSPQELASVEAGVGTVYLHGSIQYRDVFGRRHYSNFQHFRLQGSHKFGGSPQGNEAS